MILRLATLGVLLVVAYGAMYASQRRRSKTIVRAPVGLTLVTAPGCRECVNAEQRLNELGARFRRVDVSDAGSLTDLSRSVPFAVVVSSDGKVEMVRRGRAVAEDAEALIRRAV